MPRTLVLGNGSLLATFDEFLQMRDFYFPYIGMEDHTTFGNVHRLGFYVEGKGCSWVSDGTWRITPGWRTETLVGHSELVNERLGIAVTIEDAVHPVHTILLRRFTVRVLDGSERVVKCFFHHNFHIYGDTQKDTAFYEPSTNTVIHYREQRYFLIGGGTDSPLSCRLPVQAGIYESVLHSLRDVPASGLSAFSIGKANYRGLEGTWRDAEDGELSRNAIEQGSVDSTVGVDAMVRPGETAVVNLWICAGKSLTDSVSLHRLVQQETPERLIGNCANYWKSWVNKGRRSFGSLGDDLTDLYKRSLLAIRLHADAGGGILAAADADIMAFNRDTYTYVWPRDGAFVSMALDDAGYGEISRRFFEFCARAQTPDGYLLHKYNPDGSVGSSWHPWCSNGELQLPIQEDETALVLCALARHFEASQDFEFLQRMYESFIRGAAQFLCNYREEETGLPFPSYDPWEEHRGIFTYTTATVVAGLHAAAHVSQLLGHHTHSERYQAAGDDMKQALLFHLFDEETQRFVKMIRRKGNRTVEKDRTPDASLAILWKLNILPPGDPRIVSTMRQLEEALTVRTDIGGWARFTNDTYHAPAPPTAGVPGNPWIITTLWNAQYKILRASSAADLDIPRRALHWVKRWALPTNLLAEQIHPYTGAPLSVAPLTWSHATYVETVLMFVEKEKKLA